jgi:hypothetical protein
MSQQMIFLPQREIIWWKKVEREPLGFSENVQFFQKGRDLYYSHAVTLIENCVVVFWISNSLARFVRTNVSEEHTASIFKIEKIVTMAWAFQVAGEGSCYLWRIIAAENQESCSLGSSKEVAIRFFLPSNVDIIGAPVPAIAG